jgi:hypothetical protein
MIGGCRMTAEAAKKLFMSLKSYKEFDENRGSFRNLVFDDEVKKHSDEIFPKADFGENDPKYNIMNDFKDYE